jgi:prepilin-type processing-associated H-X9-DG protein
VAIVQLPAPAVRGGRALDPATRALAPTREFLPIEGSIDVGGMSQVPHVMRYVQSVMLRPVALAQSKQPVQLARSREVVYHRCMLIRRMLLVEILSCTLITAVVAAALVPLHTPADASGDKCVSNVKDTSHGMILYASDSDDKLPIKAGWMDTVAPYVKDKAAFHCPSVGQDQFGYAYNFACAGAQISTLPRPTKTSLIFDSTVMKKGTVQTLVTIPRPGRHDGKNTISYCDGHVSSEVPFR